MFKVEIRNGPELRRALKKYASVLTRPRVLGALRKSSRGLAAAATARAPRSDTAPHMADSIIVRAIPKRQTGSGQIGVAVGPSREFFYAWFQEFGTAHHAAQPFMRPALDTTADSTTQSTGDELWRVMMRHKPPQVGP